MCEIENILSARKEKKVKKIKKTLGKALRTNILDRLGIDEKTYKDQKGKESQIK